MKNEIDNYETAIGIFYGASLFLEMLLSTLMIGLNKISYGIDWIFPIFVGFLTFLFVGLLCHGIISIIRKN